MPTQTLISVVIATLLLFLALDSAKYAQAVGGRSLPSNVNLPVARNWRSEVLEAVDGATNQVQNNLIVVLNELGRDTLKLGRTIKFGISKNLIKLIETLNNFILLFKTRWSMPSSTERLTSLESLHQPRNY
jgi:hypothetical protein